MKRNSLKNILVPLDFSKSSLNALETAITIAKQQGAKITLLNVVELGFMFQMGGGAYISPNAIDNLMEVALDKINALKLSVKEKHQLVCNSIIKVGDVAEAILIAAYDNYTDLIVMGTHGISGFRELFIGSTAQKVIKISSCPVLTIPANAKWLYFKKILFPLRTVKGINEKYDFLMKLSSGTKAFIHLFTISSTKDETEIKLLDKLTQEVKNKIINDKVEFSETIGSESNTSNAILKKAKSMRADLIVITTDSEFGQILFGPFEQHIVNHATMPVLTVKPKSTTLQESYSIWKIKQSFPSLVESFD